VTFHTLRFN